MAFRVRLYNRSQRAQKGCEGQVDLSAEFEVYDNQPAQLPLCYTLVARKEG